ncbi:MAG: S8 family peptidase [Ideonella sp.]|nr:S8 family peptidase [Ideonella sp.]
MTMLRCRSRLAGVPLALAALVSSLLAAAPRDAVAQSAGVLADARLARVIVKYRAGGALMRESALAARDPDRVAVQQAARLSQRLGLALRDGLAFAPRSQVLFARGVSSAELVARLQADPDVEYAEVDARMHITAVPNDPRYADNQPVVTPTAGQWYLRPPSTTFVSAIDAQTAWTTTKGSPAIVVAVLDTGVRPDHPDLAGKLLPGYDFVSADGDGSFTSANDGSGRDADASDPGDWVTSADIAPGGPLAGQGCVTGPSSWHGTQTAALIGAVTDNGVGMASVGWNVRVVPVRVLGKCGGFTSDVIAGMYWAAGIEIPAKTSEGMTLGTAPPNPFPAKVLNMSLGSSDTSCGRSYQDAVDAVVAQGASVVVSAGNDAGLAVGRPANCDKAIGVGGLRHVGTKVGFSDVGPQIAISAPGGNCVNDLDANPSLPCLLPILTATNTGATAPAANIYSDSFNYSVGTSFSAPMVAATAALMLSVNPTLNPAQVRSTLQVSSREFPDSGGTDGTLTCQPPTTAQQLECYCTKGTCGEGMLDARAAVLAVSPPATTQALAFATPAAPAPGGSVTLDGSTSVAGSGRAITGYQWTLQEAGGIATLVPPTNAASAVVTTSGGGTFVARLVVTDDGGGAPASTTVTVIAAAPTAPPANGDGGGAASWPWLLALGLATAALRARCT